MEKNKSKKVDLLLPNDIILGKYKVIKPINKGGMDSYIYSAINTSLDTSLSTDAQIEQVVIKVVQRTPTMKEHNWTKFLEELVTASRVRHANLVQTYDVVTQKLEVLRNNRIVVLNDVAIIVMESVDGPSLRNLLNTKGYFSVDEAMYYFKKIVLGIKRLHTYTHMIIHRDLKPENILLSKDLREIKILDFGISSSVIVENFNFITITEEQSLFGTVEYMSPDNLDFNIDPKTNKKIRKPPTPQFDFHSLGIILFEMLTGDKPFTKSSKDDKETIKKARLYDIPVMKGIRYDIPNSIDNIVFRCIASKIEDLKYRYSNCDELLSDIETYDQPNRINEELLKPIASRVLEREDSFNPQFSKSKESWYYKKYLVVNCSLLFFLITILVLVLTIVHFTK
ncbi:serine/threonine-protein kinase [Mycoplasmoides alvi]|uniref:serine/threonine-protein kinase n=1 Tax=Mycoplasmoides alvi TaxID=78580 RepID=UPI00051C0548|nr:serine/threonine-protein kinase [Mycoplasmoides alvi]